MDAPERDGKADKSKAAFKLDLIETVNADPQLEASDLKVIAAYTAVMKWPRREAWLSTSRARAMTGLSERQISNSRARLAGKLKRKEKEKAPRVYLNEVRKEGITTVYRIENPWRDDCRQHVAILTEAYREKQKDRQAERRRLVRHVPAINADTEGDLSHSPSECDVSAMNAGNIPLIYPSEYSSEGRTSS
jgi:hypothetical protein